MPTLKAQRKQAKREQKRADRAAQHHAAPADRPAPIPAFPPHFHKGSGIAARPDGQTVVIRRYDPYTAVAAAQCGRPYGANYVDGMSEHCRTWEVCETGNPGFIDRAQIADERARDRVMSKSQFEPVGV